MNLNKPMSWDEFKQMPIDLQKEYVLKCVDTYGCRMSDFARLFGVNAVTVKRNFEKLSLSPNPFHAGERMSKEQRTVFDAWISGKEDAKDEEQPEEEQKDESVPVAKYDKITIPHDGCDHLEMSFSGLIDYFNIMTSIYQFANGSPIRLKISVDKVV